MCNSPIDNLINDYKQAKARVGYLESQLNQYKQIGTIKKEDVTNYSSQINIHTTGNEVYVEFLNKRFYLNQSQLLMLANLNGLFNNISGGSQ